jgi:outer membrane protein, adhesin transport system
MSPVQPPPPPKQVRPVRVVPLAQMGLSASAGLALARHPDIGRASAAVSRSDADVSVAEAAWYPKFGYTSNISALGTGSASSSLTSGTNTVGAEVTQLIYDFGRANSEIAATEASRLQRTAELRDAMERVALESCTAHLELARSTDLLKSADHYIASLQKVRQTIQLRAASGAAGQADVFLADVRLQTAEGDRIRAITRKTTASSKLNRIIGVVPKNVRDPSPEILAIATSLTGGNGDGVAGVAAAEHAAAVAKARIALAQASYFPSISLKGSRTYAIDDPAHQSSDLLGLSIQGDFFTSGATEGRLKAARQDAVAAERATELARLNSNTEVDAANAEITGAKLRRGVFSRQAALARNARDIYLDEYQLGKRTLTEVLNAEQEISRADVEQINAIADAWNAVVRAAAARSQLVAALETLDRK